MITFDKVMWCNSTRLNCFISLIISVASRCGFQPLGRKKPLISPICLQKWSSVVSCNMVLIGEVYNLLYLNNSCRPII